MYYHYNYIYAVICRCNGQYIKLCRCADRFDTWSIMEPLVWASTEKNRCSPPGPIAGKKRLDLESD